MCILGGVDTLVLDKRYKCTSSFRIHVHMYGFFLAFKQSLVPGKAQSCVTWERLRDLVLLLNFSRLFYLSQCLCEHVHEASLWARQPGCHHVLWWGAKGDSEQTEYSHQDRHHEAGQKQGMDMYVYIMGGRSERVWEWDLETNLPTHL